VFLDNRDGDNIDYISIPSEILREMGEVRVDFEEVKEKGFDGEMHDYMAVIWKDPSNATTKKYDVNNHIVIAGCDAKVVNGKKLQCKKKELYIVFHPIDEWISHHIVDLQSKSKR